MNNVFEHLGHKGPALPPQALVEVGHSLGLGLPSVSSLIHNSDI